MEYYRKILKPKKIRLNVHPYCSEELKGPKFIDKVNRPYIYKNILRLLKSQLKYQPIMDSSVIENKNRYMYKYSKIQNNINDFLTYAKTLDINKNHFIISHSNFLINLAKTLIPDSRVLFDNLDIFHIQIDPNSNNYFKLESLINNNQTADLTSNTLNNQAIGIYEWRDKYNTRKNTFNKPKKGMINIFIMRHCAACHNHPKATKFKKLTKNNYGSNSICFPEIINQFLDKNNNPNSYLKGLSKIIKKYGGFDKFQFGSSIIFRAILTSIIIYNLLRRTT